MIGRISIVTMKELKHCLTYAACVALLWPQVGRSARDYNLESYQVILDREPFGSVPAPPPPEEDPGDRLADAPPPFIKSLRMCAITETEDFGLRVGIVDIKAKPPSSHMMRIGEIQEGIELVEADFDREGALLKKDGLKYWIYLDGSQGSGPGGAHGKPGKPSASAAPPQPRPPQAELARSGSSGSYTDRLKKRREILEARRKQSEERQKMGPEALKEQLKEYQMELIRAKGELGPPLPIPLTKEMDDQLVAEGVLPPAK